MPRSSHSRRHRSSASRHEARWRQRALFVLVTLVGTFVLVGVCLLSSAGRIVLGLVGGAAALFALAVLSCLAGRLAAAARNLFVETIGRHSLEKFGRDHPPYRAS